MNPDYIDAQREAFSKEGRATDHADVGREATARPWIDRPWKISNYRPFGIIARDPEESTYALGDDKFAFILEPRGTLEERRALAHRVIADHNNKLADLATIAAQRKVIKALREAAKKALTCASLNSDVRQLLRAALELAKGGTGD